jgi:hypothetical protein
VCDCEMHAVFHGVPPVLLPRHASLPPARTSFTVARCLDLFFLSLPLAIKRPSENTAACALCALSSQLSALSSPCGAPRRAGGLLANRQLTDDSNSVVIDLCRGPDMVAQVAGCVLAREHTRA